MCPRYSNELLSECRDFDHAAYPSTGYRAFKISTACAYTDASLQILFPGDQLPMRMLTDSNFQSVRDHISRRGVLLAVCMADQVTFLTI